MEIPLGINQDIKLVALCSNEDYEALKKIKWYKNGNYAKVKDGKGLDILMHSYIIKELMKMDVPDGKVIDHINNNYSK